MNKEVIKYFWEKTYIYIYIYINCPIDMKYLAFDTKTLLLETWLSPIIQWAL